MHECENIGHSPVSGIDCKVRFDNTKEASEIYAETTEMGQEQVHNTFIINLFYIHPFHRQF